MARRKQWHELTREEQDLALVGIASTAEQEDRDARTLDGLTSNSAHSAEGYARAATKHRRTAEALRAALRLLREPRKGE